MWKYCGCMDIRVVLALATLLPAVVFIAGCSKKEKNIVTQVAARVNGDEITVHQINNVLNQNQDVPPEAAAAAKREILERLIDQQLAVQKAVENKLDRSHKVMSAIEAAKSEIIARAYLEEIVADVPQRLLWDVQSRREVREYYSEHPELFAQRRIFTLEELSFVTKGGVAPGLREQMSKSRSMQEIADWLKTKDIRFAARRGERMAEQISLKILPKVQDMKAGEIQLLELGDERYEVIRVVTFKEAPIDEAAAAPRIQQFLSSQQSSEIVAQRMKQIREQAKIEYLGEFAGGASRVDRVESQTDTKN